ncbi:MAG: aminotransferase class V-fold PLP-dependent enzyme [Pseudomonadota bacterium]
MTRIYLDHAATSPLRPEARAAMEEGFALWANPSSPHAEGRKAKQALEDARERIKRALGWDGEVIYTSGASEALWIALNRSKAKRRIVSAVEHDAVFRAAPDAEVVPLDELNLTVDEEAFGIALEAGDPAVVALQAINSETGLCFYQGHGFTDIAAVSTLVRGKGGLVLCDASQAAGRVVLPDADIIVISAHKFGGPIGIGALLVRDFAMLEPIGGHERGYRQGTENMPAALGMAAALECWKPGANPPTKSHEFEKARIEYASYFETGYECGYIVPFVHPTLSAQALLIRLDTMGFAVSAGSACSSGTLKKSRVLDAFGVPDDVAARTIRVSLGWSTTAEELDAFAEAWKSLV